tara:strand:+ start:218 stop:1276 length:1059 start_codon:yes stop_codon:yes gene_type:complete
MDKESVIAVFAKKTTRRDSTNQAYATRFMAMTKKYNNYKEEAEPYTDYTFLQNIEDVIKWITEVPNTRKDKHGNFKLPSPSTQLGNINPIIEFLLASDEHSLSDDYLKYKIVIDDKMETISQKSNGITDLQKENMITYEELVKFMELVDDEIKVMKDKELKTHLDEWCIEDLKTLRLLLRIYILYPSRNEYSTLKFIGLRDYNKLKQPEFNYVVLGQKKSYLSITNYKTSSKYNLKLTELTDKPLLKMLRTLKNSRDIEGRENLFYLQKTGQPYDNNNLCSLMTKFSKKLINKNIGSTLIYKIVIKEAGLNYTDALKNDDITGAVKFNEILAKYAKIRGHSQQIQKKIYMES